MDRIVAIAVPQKVFKPEKYWKVVQPDEAIPRGLHVRINLQTGKKEAKLLDRSEQRLQKKIYPEDLKMYLKSMKNEGDNLNMVSDYCLYYLPRVELGFINTCIVLQVLVLW